MGAEYSGPELERTLIARIEEFLRAMGGMFAFMVIWLGDVVENMHYALTGILKSAACFSG
jgi:hypothetical protein